MLLNQESYSLELSLVAPNCFQLKATQVGKLQEALAKATGEMEGAAATISGFGDVLTQHRERIDEVTGTLTGHEDRIALVSSALSSHSQAITQHRDHIHAVSETLTQHDDEIAQGKSVLKVTTERHNERICQLHFQVSTTDTKVAELNKEVVELNEKVVELHNGCCRQSKRNIFLLNI